MRKKTKFILLRASVVAVFVLLAGRVWYVQVVMGSYYKAQGDTSKIRKQPVPALRGVIYDRSGKQLVWNAPSWNVMIVPHGIPFDRRRPIFHRLSQLLHGNPTPKQMMETLRKNEWRPYAAVLLKPRISGDLAMIIKQLHGDLPGVLAEPSSIRRYFQDSQLSFSHMLGYTAEITEAAFKGATRAYPQLHFSNNDTVGASGLEAGLDALLHGVNGTQRVEVDAGERPIRTLSTRPSIAGDSVSLTLDAKLQQAVARDLGAALQKLNLRRGVAIVEDVQNGSVLAMVSLPSFNNNWFSGGISAKRYRQLLHDPAQPLNDMSISGLFPPGSTYKIVTAAAALQTGVVNANTTIDDTGSIKLCAPGSTVGCRIYYGWMPTGLGEMNVVSALAESGDIYFYTVAAGNPNISAHMPQIGAQRLAAYARQFGLGGPTGIELPNEAAGLVPSPSWYMRQKWPIRNPGDTWHIGDTYNMAIGQGFNEATPLQMANIAATIANGGTLYRPRLVRRISGRITPNGHVLKRTRTIESFRPAVIRQNFLDPSTVNLIQQGMHHSVDWPMPRGTSFNVTDKRIDAAGKTGTAEALPHPAHSWWIGYAPYQNPKIAVAVLVPNANSEGAYTAAPIAHKIFEDYFHLPPLKRNWLDNVVQELVPGGNGAQ